MQQCHWFAATWCPWWFILLLWTSGRCFLKWDYLSSPVGPYCTGVYYSVSYSVVFTELFWLQSLVWISVGFVLVFFILYASKQGVHAFIYKDLSLSDPSEIVQLKGQNGVWSAKVPRDWEGYYYVYEVSVYHPSTLQIEKCIVNDPYARGYAISILAYYYLKYIRCYSSSIICHSWIALFHMLLQPCQGTVFT